MDENQPTEPLPSENQQAASRPAADRPVAAGPQPVAAPVHEPFYRRHGLAFAISTLVLGIVVIVGVLGAGTFVAVNVVGHSISAFERGHGLLGHARGDGNGRGDGSGQGQGGQGQGGQNGGAPGSGTQREMVRGTLDSASGSSWTLTTSSGKKATVAVTSSTAFGLPNESARASDFAAGDEVIVVGTDRSGDHITATRILKLADFPRPPSTPGATPGSGRL